MTRLFSALLVLAAVNVSGSPIFLDTYDNAEPGSKLPFSYTSFGFPSRVGVSNLVGDCISGSQGGFVEVTFSNATWGAGIARYGLNVDLTNSILSVQIKSDQDMASKQGIVGFRISDSDGTVVRTPNQSLYAPTQKFFKFSEPISALSEIDSPGKTPGIDLRHITSIGILFYNRGDSLGTNLRFVFDDLQAQTSY